MIRRFLPVLIAFSLYLTPPAAALAGGNTVNAVLFYDPNSAASQQVFSDILPPVVEKQGEHLVIYLVDISREEGQQLFQSAISSLNIPENNQRTPLIIVGTSILSGIEAIQNSFTNLVDQQPTGASWPAIPGLQDALQRAGIIRSPQNPWQNFLKDQPGNSLAVVVLIGLIVSLVYSILSTFHLVKDVFSSLPKWKIPLLLLIGIVISSYLSYTELTRSEVVCGGISNCQAVQDSQFSKLLGAVPIGIFGLAGNILIGIAWLLSMVTRGSLRSVSTLVMLGLSVFGASYSLYLTFLEPFVIGATCLWCLGSAIVMGLILPSTVGPVRELIQQYNQAGKGLSSTTG